jgi:hypothetical protein
MSSSSDRRWSWVYAFGFFQLPPSPAIKVKCISCGTVMSANSGGGTSHLQRHLTRTCKNQATRAVAQFVKKKVADHEAGAGRQLQRLSSMKGTYVHGRLLLPRSASYIYRVPPGGSRLPAPVPPPPPLPPAGSFHSRSRLPAAGGAPAALPRRPRARHHQRGPACRREPYIHPRSKCAGNKCSWSLDP